MRTNKLVNTLSERRLAMFSRTRRLVLVAAAAVVLACAVVGACATPAFGYGKATWQAALTGTFNFPGTGFSEGFWGWCDFVGSAGSVTSGDEADCQIAEYLHESGGAGWTCEVDVSGTNWDESVQNFPFPTFHISGSLVVHPGSLTTAEQDACVGFFATGDPTVSYPSRTFTNVDTFIPAAPGHYDFGVSFIPGAVGEFNFTVRQIP